MSLFARMYNQIRGRISLFFSSLEFRNPEVLLENAKEDLRRIAASDTLGQLADGFRLIAGRFIRGVKLEIHTLYLVFLEQRTDGWGWGFRSASGNRRLYPDSCRQVPC